MHVLERVAFANEPFDPVVGLLEVAIVPEADLLRFERLQDALRPGDGALHLPQLHRVAG